MKSLLLATAAVAVLAAAPALAQEPVGSVGVTYSDSSIDFDGFEADADGYAIDGSVAIPAVGDWTVTLAATGSQTDDGFDEDSAISGTAHLTRLVGSDLRVGGFIGAADVADETAFTAGAEIQKYLGQATLTGVVAYTTVDEFDIDAWSVGGNAAFYPMESLRLDAGVGYIGVDAAGTDVDGYTYGVGAEYQIGGSPFSVTGSYARADIEDAEIDTFSIGLRFSFGGGLQARDRAGASLPGTGVLGILGAL